MDLLSSLRKQIRHKWLHQVLCGKKSSSFLSNLAYCSPQNYSVLCIQALESLFRLLECDVLFYLNLEQIMYFCQALEHHCLNQATLLSSNSQAHILFFYVLVRLCLQVQVYKSEFYLNCTQQKRVHCLDRKPCVMEPFYRDLLIFSKCCCWLRMRKYRAQIRKSVQSVCLWFASQAKLRSSLSCHS